VLIGDKFSRRQKFPIEQPIEKLITYRVTTW